MTAWLFNLNPGDTTYVDLGSASVDPTPVKVRVTRVTRSAIFVIYPKAGTLMEHRFRRVDGYLAGDSTRWLRRRRLVRTPVV